MRRCLVLATDEASAVLATPVHEAASWVVGCPIA